MLERLLSTRLVYADVRASRHINFDYLNRQLMWSEASVFILLVLPRVHMGSVGRSVSTYLPMNVSRLRDNKRVSNSVSGHALSAYVLLLLFRVARLLGGAPLFRVLGTGTAYVFCLMRFMNANSRTNEEMASIFTC